MLLKISLRRHTVSEGLKSGYINIAKEKNMPIAVQINVEVRKEILTILLLALSRVEEFEQKITNF